MKILVSVIVPVYNVEQYLVQCIESILTQTYKCVEVVLVDDGSTDNSGVICDEYAKKDSRIVVLHKSNGGLSDARNVGLEKAKGDYILFIDSDDFWIDERQLEQLMLEVAKTPSCDFIGFNCSYYYTDGDRYLPWVAYTDKIVNLSNCHELIINLVRLGTFPMSACLKVIKRGFLIDNNIRFIKEIVCEDIPWFIEMLYYSQNFRVINQYMYAYRQCVQGSITKSFSSKSFNDLLGILSSQTFFIQKSNFPTLVKSALLSFMAYEFCILLGYFSTISKETQIEKKNELLSYRWLLEYKENPKVKKVSCCNRLLGIQLTEMLLSFYLKIKI